jgi:hypothetical protein
MVEAAYSTSKIKGSGFEIAAVRFGRMSSKGDRTARYLYVPCDSDCCHGRDFTNPQDLLWQRQSKLLQQCPGSFTTGAEYVPGGGHVLQAPSFSEPWVLGSLAEGAATHRQHGATPHSIA